MSLVAAAVLTPVGPARADYIRDGEWHLTFLKVADAQKITTGANVTVAVVDTGVYPHPDIKRNLLKGTDVISGGKGDGQDDQNGHGTEMAGLIAAHGRGKDGVLGIAPSAKLLPVKDANTKDNGGTLTIADGVSWASSHGAKVINVSSATGPSIRLEAAIAAAGKADAVVVAGTGNTSRMLQMGYPAAMPGVLAVGAIDRSGKHAAISVTGPATQLCAPGVGVLSTEPPRKYSTFDGTSPATAIVSGAAALVRAKFPQLSAQEVIHRLTATATDTGKPGRDNECGFGVLNIVKALTADVPPLEPSAGASAGTPAPARSTPPAAAPETQSTSNALPAVVGGVVIVVLVGGLAAFLAIRRRKSS
jgi:type VII secretion-associated serine protease mycosin